MGEFCFHSLTNFPLSLIQCFFSSFSDAIFNIGVQINLMDITEGREDVALATSSSSNKLEETVSSVLGHKFLGTLARVELSLDTILKKQSTDDDEVCYNFGIKGLISKTPQGKSPGRTVDYYSINGRVVELPKVTNILRKVWNGFGGKKKPSCLLCFTLPNDAFDINLSPDKQHVLFTQEQEIYQLVQEHMTQFWASQTNGVFHAQEFDLPLEEGEDMEDGERQTHKRRFGFVHDLSKAKMQHECPGRETVNNFRGMDEEKKQVEVDETDTKPQATTPQQPSASGTPKGDEEKKRSPRQPTSATIAIDVEEPPSKKAKLVSRSAEAVDKSSRVPENDDAEIDCIGRATRQSLRRNELSDLERRKWTEIQQKFNGGENSSTEQLQPQSTSTPVTPDDIPPHATMTTQRPKSSRVAQVPSFKDKQQARANPNQTDDKSRKASPKPVCLNQFAFQSSNDGNSSNASPSRSNRISVETTNSTVKEPPPNNRRDGEVKVARKKVHDDGDDEEERDTTGVNIKERAKSRSHAKEPETVSQRQGARQEILSTTPGSNESPLPIDENPESAAAPALSEPVVWKSFQGTEAICCSARLERFGMRERKRCNDEIRKSNAWKKPSLDKDAEDVAKSVGSQDSQDCMISLSKSEFRQDMQVIGQFNLGFILARCKSNHLWILDQHACDEKYNFEDLCRNTVIHEQKLLKPMPLDNLSPSEEACILDHMDVFEANGFRFDFKPEAPVRHRLFLTGLPHSGAQDGRKAVQFGKDDVSALCSILSEGSSYDAGDGGTGTDGSGKYGNNAVRRYASTASSQIGTADKIVARLPKAIAMFASRACRTSIMIGTALSQKEMNKIVRRLADVEHPWNCPHGRPTMRHVGGILPVLSKDERKAIGYITGPTATVTPMTQEPSGDLDE